MSVEAESSVVATSLKITNINCDVNFVDGRLWQTGTGT